ncbi:hypothetical protein VM1G_08340 [Cytospora mali]|uniref:RING-type domain-containing protein n=1 Tax=Cytospora mali TaxID=578113 RepID=A0A194WA96_CYTMA|nr:hypothetical protein VM1G_08340 [Valsa mali]
MASMVPSSTPDTLEAAIRDYEYTRWGGEDGLIQESADKILAEQKCRQDASHPLPDSVGVWLQNETHASEHRPWLNNVSTAIKRTLIDKTMNTYEHPDNLAIQFYRIQTDEEEFMNQRFIDEVSDWWRRRNRLDAERLSVPTLPDSKIPWEFVEYVPLYSTTTLNSRLDQLKSSIDSTVDRLETWVPRSHDLILQGREPEDAEAHEEFFRQTLGFIHELLAFDPGLGESRMMDIAQWFSFIVVEPWAGLPEFEHLAGYPVMRNVSAVHNSLLRTNLADTATWSRRVGFNPGESFWRQDGYTGGNNPLTFKGPGFRPSNPTASDAHAGAVSRWMEFYKLCLMYLSDAEARENHTAISQEDCAEHVRQGRMADGCVVCGSEWTALRAPFNFPISFRPCGERHAVCMGCFKHITLQPANLNGRKCPMCRQDIQYSLRGINYRSDLGLELNLPSLAGVSL